MIPAYFVYGLNEIQKQVLLAAKQELDIFIASLVSFIAFVLLAAVFVLHLQLGIVGIAYTFLTKEVISLLLVTFLVYRNQNTRIIINSIDKQQSMRTFDKSVRRTAERSLPFFANELSKGLILILSGFISLDALATQTILINFGAFYYSFLNGYFQFSTLELNESMGSLDVKKAKKIGLYAVAVGLGKAILLALLFTSCNSLISKMYSNTLTLQNNV